MLTLADAIKSGRLQEFAAQEEARGMGPIDRAEFDGTVKKVIAPRSKDRTSRSSSGDGLSGKRTRQGSDQDTSG